jgi:hypothetical protein
VASPILPGAFPNGKDRTPNDPCILLTSLELLKLYNYNHLDIKEYEVNDIVKQWVNEAAPGQNWQEIKFYGNQVLLVANVKIV